MRSRYTAFALGTQVALGYLVATQHASQRPARLLAELEASVAGVEAWTGLAVLASSASGDAGEVEFIASYLAAGRPGQLHERSRFVREEGSWFYVDGDVF